MSVDNICGLEILKQIVEGKRPEPSMSDTINMKLTNVERGVVEARAVPSEQHLNGLGTVHGGFAATVLDTVAGLAIMTMLEPYLGHSTVDLNIRVFDTIPKGKELIGEGKVNHISKWVGFSEGLLKDKEGNIYAHATVTCIIRR